MKSALFRSVLTVSAIVFAALFLSPVLCVALDVTSETLISRIPESATAVTYIPDVKDFGNYKKWSPIYNYIFVEEYGGVKLTPEGERLLERFERWIKMPARDLLAVFSGEAALWVEVNEFSKKGVSFGAAFVTDQSARLKAVFEDNFLNNRDYVECQPAGAGDYSYSVSYKFPNGFVPGSKDFLKGGFAIGITSSEVFLASDGQYLKKIHDYSSSAREKEPAFKTHLLSLKNTDAMGLFIDISRVYELAVKTADNAEASMAASKSPRKGAEDDSKIFRDILSILELKSLSDIRMQYRMEDSRVVANGAVTSAGRSGLLKLMGGGAKVSDIASICPADSSTLIYLSFNFIEFFDLYEKLMEKAPPMVKTQYFMGKTAVCAFLGMKIREDLMGMFDGDAIFITKMLSTKDDPILSLPTVILKLKNSRTAEKIVARLSEKGLLGEFEEKEMLGAKYYSLKKPIAGAFSLTFCVTGGYFVFSTYFDHFSAVMRLLQKPGDGIGAQKKFTGAVADLPEKLSFFVYSDDEEVSDIYFRNAGIGKSALKNDNPFFRQNESRIDWARIKAHQAPSVFGIFIGDKGLEIKGVSNFKRDGADSSN